MLSDRAARGFVTDTGIAVPAVMGAEMRELDRIATEETGPNLLQMMENAERNLALLAIEVLGGGWQTAKFAVLARTGDLFLADIGIPEGAYRRVMRTYIPPFGDRYRVPLARR